jgi:hypothetical protein
MQSIDDEPRHAADKGDIDGIELQPAQFTPNHQSEPAADDENFHDIKIDIRNHDTLKVRDEKSGPQHNWYDISLRHPNNENSRHEQNDDAPRRNIGYAVRPPNNFFRIDEFFHEFSLNLSFLMHRMATPRPTLDEPAQRVRCDNAD